MPIMSCVNPSRHPDTPESTRNSSQQCQVGDLGGLNFGDCFAYALAEATEEPLLFKGRDFALTDIEPA